MYTLKNLKRRSARTVLTIIGVSLAITLAMIMFSISEGIRESTDEIIEKSGIDLLVFPKGADIFFGGGEFTNGRELAAKINQSEKIRATFPYLRERIYVTGNAIDKETNLPKVTSIVAKGSFREASETFKTADVIQGTQLQERGDPYYTDGTFTHEILLNSMLANFLGINLEDDFEDTVYLSMELPSTSEDIPADEAFQQWFENTTSFNVKGILTQSFEDEGDMSATLHLSELQNITNKLQNDTADTIVIDLYNPKDADSVKYWLENEFEEKDEITAYTQEDVREEIEKFTSLYRGFSEMVAGITILVALLFISTVIMISVKERTGELCALRALGFSRASVFKLVLAEALLVCLIGFVIGVIFGAIGTELINIYAENEAPQLPEGFQIAKITPGLLLRATGSVFIFGVLVGLIPAYWASRLNIIDALKSE
ncbi:MAG: ABC transporter permease [Thermoplasmata archaeon]|nr:MAG: ABC transporter permease [Thermoplasmata archaeon]